MKNSNTYHSFICWLRENLWNVGTNTNSVNSVLPETKNASLFVSKSQPDMVQTWFGLNTEGH